MNNHAEASELNNYKDRQSNYYLSYPTGRLGLQGKYEDLQSFCGFLFHPKYTKTIEKIVESNHFDWTCAKQYEEILRKRNESVTTSRIVLMSYLFQCSYDLLLSCKDSVSNSPGFEKVSVQYGPKKHSA